ncbi:MAG: CapA family protein, partial [Desulfovibrionaceae bacterium]|nr:CapA family protein [Desulfovibrionaceae bacterium]
MKDDLAERLVALKPLASASAGFELEGQRRSVLFFSCSDGQRRARVITAAGATPDVAWAAGVARLQALELPARWLRVDWVTTAARANWREVRRMFQQVKRNYFRRGIALDAGFERAFLEMELSGNAMLYPGPGVAATAVNERNFLRYARQRHGLTAVDFCDDAPVWLFSTHGAFAGDDGVAWPLDGDGRDAGRRRIAPLTPPDLTRLIDAGSRYLASQVTESGKFHYGWHPCFDREIPAYNSLRHASSLYAMLEAWEVTREPALLAAIEQSLAYLTGELIHRAALPGGQPAAFLVDPGNEIKLGGNAVSILALTKYSTLLASNRHHELLQELATGILHMQNPQTGAFNHVLDYPSLDVKAAFRTIYYEGEAAFALMRLHALAPDARWIGAVELAFSNFIANGYHQHHDHWLSYAANELTRYRPEERYYAFGIANVEGHLDFVLNRITTFPTLLELMMASAKLLSRLAESGQFAHLLERLDLDKFYRALDARAAYLLNGHFWPELAMFFANPARIVGSFFIRHHAFRVRIDDVEHYLSGYVAYRGHLLAGPVKVAPPPKPPEPEAPPLLPSPLAGEGLGERGSSAEIKPAAALPGDGPRAEARQVIDISALPHTFFPREGADGITLSRQRNARPCWSADELAQATGGRWAVPPPPGWQAVGLCSSMAAFSPGALAVRELGIAPAQLRDLRHYLAGVICEKPEKCLELGIPVLAVPAMKAALRNIGKYARNHYNGKVIAITGSSGKTTTIHLLADMLTPFGMVDFSRGSANLSVSAGVTMSNMPRDIPFWLLEMTFDQIDISSKICKPHIAIVLTIAEAHLSHMGDLRGVARQKSLVFEGMEPGGIAVLNRDMPEYELIENAAVKKGLQIIRFGRHQDAQLRLLDYAGGLLRFSAYGVEYQLTCFLPDYVIGNVLAALACISALGLPMEQCFPILAQAQMLPGRGKRHSLRVDDKPITLIDDAYNANVGSMSASLGSLRAAVPGQSHRLVILGDMAELGAEEAQKHLELEGPIRQAEPDRLLLCGPLMRPLWDRLKLSFKGAWFARPQDVEAEVFSWLMPGDTVLVKSSGHKLAKVVEKMLQAGLCPEGGGDGASLTVSIAFGGDVNLGRRQHEIARRNGPAQALSRLDALTQADFSIVNLECVVATCGQHRVEKGERSPYYFRARPEQLQILADAKIGMVLTANNHSGDYGADALLEQKNLLEQSGFLFAGSGASLQEASAPVLVRVGEYILAVFSVDTTCRYFAAGKDRPGAWHLPLHNPDLWYHELTPRIALARRQADAVLVGVHWGDNAAQEPSPEQRQIGKAIIKAGADAVLGSSPHGLLGIEVHMNRPIIHAAGDLLFESKTKNHVDSGVFVLKLGSGGITELDFYPVERNHGYSLPATGEKAAEGIADFVKKSAALGVALETMPERARLRLSPSRQPAREIPEIPPASYAAAVQRPAAPIPSPLLRHPRPEWIAAAVPGHARQTPRQIGPLTLHGWHIPLECLRMTERRTLWIESWWSASAPLAEDLMLYFLAVPESGGAPVYGQDMWHDPCDWMWHTSRWQAGVLYHDVIGF